MKKSTRLIFISPDLLCGLLVILSSAVACNSGGNASPSPVVQAKADLGGVDGSGGDVAHSTSSQVHETLKTLRSELRQSFNRIDRAMEDDTFRSTSSLAPALKSALVQMLRGNASQAQPILGFLEDSALTWNEQETEPCHDRFGDNKDASATMPSALCFSVKNLTRIAPESLRLQLLALGAHEMAHLYGFDEETAQAVQAFMISSSSLVAPPAQAVEQLADYRRIITGALNGIEADLAEHADDNRLCLKLGTLAAESARLYRLGGSAEDPTPIHLTPKMKGSMVSVSILSQSLLTYCGQNEEFLGKPLYLPAKDRPEIIERLKKIHEFENNASEKIAEYLQPGGRLMPLSFQKVTAILSLNAIKASYGSPASGAVARDLLASEVGCVYAFKVDSDPQPSISSFKPFEFYRSQAGAISHYPASYQKVGSPELVIDFGFRSFRADRAGSSGLQFIPIFKSAGRVINDGILVEPVQNVMVALDGDQKSLMPTAILQRGGAEEFRLRVLVKDHQLKMELRCKILGPGESPEMLKLITP